MKNKNLFLDLKNHFNLDKEEDNLNESYNNNKDIVHQSISSSDNNNSQNKINEKTNISTSTKKTQKIDKFGYFMNDDYYYNEQNEKSSLNNIDNDNDDYYGKYNPEEEEDEKNENDENNRNTLNSFKYKNENEDNFYKKLYENREGDGSLNDSQNNNNNPRGKRNSGENENFLLNSFRPKPRTDSPTFLNNNKINKIQNNNEIEKHINNANDNNNVCQQFTETLQTKIEGIRINEKNTNKDKDIIYSHDNNNFFSLGKMPNKDSIYSDKKNIKGGDDNIGQSSEVNRDDDDEDGKENVIEDDEETENAQLAYLNKLEEKRKKLKKYQENIKDNQYIDNNINDKNMQNSPKNNDNIIKDMSIKLLQKYINGEQEDNIKI